jgi:hypothetical protein
MSLRDALTQAHITAKKGPPCSVGVIIEQLSPDDVAALNAALSDHAITGRAITAALTSEGHKVRDHAVNRHRRGLCMCGVNA